MKAVRPLSSRLATTLRALPTAAALEVRRRHCYAWPTQLSVLHRLHAGTAAA